MKKALVCGTGGFVGGRLVEKLERKGRWLAAAQPSTPSPAEIYPNPLCANTVRSNES